MKPITLKDLFEAVDASSQSESETVATIAYLVNSGRVRLAGNLRGARFDLGTKTMPRVAAA